MFLIPDIKPQIKTKKVSILFGIHITKFDKTKLCEITWLTSLNVVQKHTPKELCTWNRFDSSHCLVEFCLFLTHHESWKSYTVTNKHFRFCSQTFPTCSALSQKNLPQRAIQVQLNYRPLVLNHDQPNWPCFFKLFPGVDIFEPTEKQITDSYKVIRV